MGGSLGLALWGLGSRPAAAEAATDVQILQTASSLESLAVAVYQVVLGTGPEGMDAPAAQALERVAPDAARSALRAFAAETARQHAVHRRAYQERTVALDGAARVQDAPNPKFLPALRSADLTTPEKVVDFAALIEKIVTDTYLTNLTMVRDPATRALLAGVMAVEAQHLAVLRTVAALFTAGAPQLVALPLPVARIRDLPQAAGNAAFPDALHHVGGPELVAEPGSGALG